MISEAPLFGPRGASSADWPEGDDPTDRPRSSAQYERPQTKLRSTSLSIVARLSSLISEGAASRNHHRRLAS